MTTCTVPPSIPGLSAKPGSFPLNASRLKAQAHYEAVEDEVCGDISPGEICYTTDEEEDRLDSAYDAYLLAWCWYVAVLDRAELAGTGLARALPYDCWGRL